MQLRLPLPNVAKLDPEQRDIHDSILATRGGLFLAWMHSPGWYLPLKNWGLSASTTPYLR